MTPLIITAHIAEPVVYSGDGMHFDGILSYGAFMALSAEQKAALPSMTDTHCEDFDLPLGRWEEVGCWGWKASAVHAEWMMSSTHYVRKRVSHEPMVRYSNSTAMNKGGGEFKSKNTPYQARSASALVWYAVGDIDAVRDLLTHVRGVAKLVGHGMGRVLRWEVLEHTDGEAWKRRALPGPGGYPATIRAPYHHRSRMCPSVIVPDYEEMRPC